MGWGRGLAGAVLSGSGPCGRQADAGLSQHEEWGFSFSASAQAPSGRTVIFDTVATFQARKGSSEQTYEAEPRNQTCNPAPILTLHFSRYRESNSFTPECPGDGWLWVQSQAGDSGCTPRPGGWTGTVSSPGWRGPAPRGRGTEAEGLQGEPVRAAEGQELRAAVPCSPASPGPGQAGTGGTGGAGPGICSLLPAQGALPAPSTHRHQALCVMRSGRPSHAGPGWPDEGAEGRGSAAFTRRRRPRCVFSSSSPPRNHAFPACFGGLRYKFVSWGSPPFPQARYSPGSVSPHIRLRQG